MGRKELEDRPTPKKETKVEGKPGVVTARPGVTAGDDVQEQKKGGGGRDHPPPWTKYLLDEGLDHTKAFSRYRGMFAGEMFLFIFQIRRKVQSSMAGTYALSSHTVSLRR